jgi:NADH-quinone oxidoreductase subunit J
MRNPVHSALFLLLTFICVAILFFLAHAEFVGAVQILVYAGGIMVLFLFVVMLINVRHLPEERTISPFWKGAIAVGIGVFILFGTVVRSGQYAAPAGSPVALRTTRVLVERQAVERNGRTVQKKVYGQRPVGNTEAVGMLLYRDYLVPFEVASLFLLVAMIGAIVIGKRELRSEEEEATQEFIIRRSSDEKQVKEAIG